MRIKDALQNIHKSHKEDVLNRLYTPWGETLDKEHVWEECPRPQMRRKQYQTLHGEWDYAIVSKETEEPFQSQGKIVVPFSPESVLSGVERQLQPEEYLWYQREIAFGEEELGRISRNERCVLHFDAVDQQATIYINGKQVCSHYGGYLPFEVDITDYVKDICILQVRVQDDSDTSYHTRGKQTLKRGGMFYTAQSGIWQSVWYEWVPENHIEKYRITPDYDAAKVYITCTSKEQFGMVSLEIKDADVKYEVQEEQREKEYLTKVVVSFANKEFTSWSPENPHLYEFKLLAGEDYVESYFAMRKFAVEKDTRGVPRFFLNNEPYFLNGVLDQGYWSDGLMTAPCDEAFVFDIELCKKLGFNMIRKHIKIEPLRWYYHCDRLGMIVWQDMVNGGTTYNMPWVCYMPTALPVLGKKIKDNLYHMFSRRSEEGRRLWEEECRGTIEHLYNVPCISTWVPFNEAWGQFDAARIAEEVKGKDPTRTVDHASGWFDQKAGDFNSVHNYFRTLRVEKDDTRAFVISEYGGYACHIKGHSSVDRIFGYKKYDTVEEVGAAFRQLIKEQIYPLIDQGLSGAVYTQLSDVEEEVNGLVTYDRKVVKMKRIQSI